MRKWRNWQTRTFEGRVGNRAGSSPAFRTKRHKKEAVGKDLRPLSFVETF